MLQYIHIEKITKLLLKLVGQKYFGKLTLVFENGNITYIRKEETIKELE